MNERLRMLGPNVAVVNSPDREDFTKFRTLIESTLASMECSIAYSDASPHEIFIFSRKCTVSRIRQACATNRDNFVRAGECSHSFELNVRAATEKDLDRVIVLSEADSARTSKTYEDATTALLEAQELKKTYEQRISECGDAQRRSTLLEAEKARLETRLNALSDRLKEAEERASPKAHQEALAAKDKEIADLNSQLESFYNETSKANDTQNIKLRRMYEQSTAQKEQEIQKLEQMLSEEAQAKSEIADQLEKARQEAGINTGSFDSILQLALRYMQDFSPKLAEIAVLFSSLRKTSDAKTLLGQPELKYLLKGDAVESAKALRQLSPEALKQKAEEMYDAEYGAEYKAKKEEAQKIKSDSQKEISALAERCSGLAVPEIKSALETAIEAFRSQVSQRIEQLENSARAYEAERSASVEKAVEYLVQAFEHIDGMKTKEEEITAIKTRKIPIAISLEGREEGNALRIILPVAENLAGALYPGVKSAGPEADAVREFVNSTAEKILFGSECLKTIMHTSPAEMKILRDAEKGTALVCYEIILPNGDSKSAFYAVTVVNEIASALKQGFTATEYGKKGFTIEALPVISSGLEKKLAQKEAAPEETPEAGAHESDLEYVCRIIKEAGEGAIEAKKLAQLTKQLGISRNRRAAIFAELKRKDEVKVVSGRAGSVLYAHSDFYRQAERRDAIRRLPEKARTVYRIINSSASPDGIKTQDLMEQAVQEGVVKDRTKRSSLRYFILQLIDAGLVELNGQSHSTKYAPRRAYAQT